MNNEKFMHTVTNEEEGKQYFELLKQNFVFSSRFRSKIKRDGLALINGKREKMYKKAKAGDIISICLPDEASDFEPEEIPFDIVYEDTDLLVIDKPAGYVVHPTKGHPVHTMANGIMHYIINSNQNFKIRFINRIDMDTTGLLIIGKNAYAQDEFTKKMKSGDVEKTYLAIVSGVISENKGIIELPIGRPDPLSVKRAVMENGAPSVTHYEIIERFKNHTLVKLLLKTGRTHQIRVHMAYIGHPLLSDELYSTASPSIIARQALHAAGLSFSHPVTNEKVELYCEPPCDFKVALTKIAK
ncbi:MAG: RluA family pseudouridine synthase [Eubacteriales bacterium]